MAFYLSALLMGLMSGAHCLGMCGPLVLALPVAEKNYWLSVIYRVVYNLGRISVYILMGTAIGMFAMLLELRLLQKNISLIAGVLLIVVSLLQLMAFQRLGILSRMHSALAAFVRPLMPKAGLTRMWLLGSVNGFLPCGMVAAALLTALSGSDIMSGTLFMLFFGLGTFPLMLVASLFGIYLGAKVRQHLAIIGPVYGICLGILLILRPGLLHPNCH